MQQPPAKFQSNKDQWYMFWEQKGCGAACWRFVGSRVLAKHGKWASSIEICMYFLFFVDFDFLSLEICFDRVARRNIISFRFRIFSCISNGQKQVEWTCCEAATLSLEIVKRLFFFLIDQKMSCDSRTICYFHKIETIRTFVEAWSEYKIHSATDISFGVFINFGNLFFPFKYLLQYIVFVFAMQPLPSYFMSES